MTKINFQRLMFLLALSVLTISVSSCGDKEDEDPVLPPIGGYNSADEVGSADLVAYFPLNGDGKESKSGVMPELKQGETWVDAIKGKGVSFTAGYMAYPQITALGTTVENITVSLWAKVTNNGGTDGYPSMLFSLTRANEWAGNVNLMSETGWRTAASDTLVMKGLVVIKNADSSANWQDIVNSANPSAADIAAGHVAAPNTNSGKWAHYVITWEANTGLFKLYANGVKISNPVWESRNGGNALPLNFFTPTRLVLGAFEPNVTGTPDGWQRPLTGGIDEIRVWKKVLSAADINSLYELEKAGR